MDLNLDKIITALEARSGELERQMLNLDAPDPETFTDRFDTLLELMTQARGEILRLRAIRNNSSAASVIVHPGSAPEIADLTAALAALDRVIREGELLDPVIAIATAALNGAARLRSVAEQVPGASITNAVAATRGVRPRSPLPAQSAPRISQRSALPSDPAIGMPRSHLELTVSGKKSVMGFRLKIPAAPFKIRQVTVSGLPSKSVPARVAVTGGELRFEWRGAGVAPGSSLMLEMEATQPFSAGLKVEWICRA